MTEHQHEEAHLRTRTLLHLPIEDQDTCVGVDHVYLPEGQAGPCCHDGCGNPAHDPGMVGLALGGELALLTAEEALVVANRLTRAASLVLEAEEDTPDIEREAARYAAPALSVVPAGDPDPVRKAVWAAWNAMPDEEGSPVKRIARDLDMTTADVAAIVYADAEFGKWHDNQEPDL